MFIHGIVHYMTYADGEWWHNRDPKPHQLWGRGHCVHRLSEGTDCLLEWGASFPKSEHPVQDQRESQKFGGDVPFLDLTLDSTQGRDGFIDDPYVPGDQGYRTLPCRERTREVHTQNPAQDTPQQTGSTEHQEHADVPVGDGVVSGKVTSTAQRIAAGAGGGPDPPPDNKLCDHCLQATARPCPWYDEHDTHECPCNHWSSESEREKQEEWKHQWESVFERKQRWLDEWESRLHNYFADLPDVRQREEPPQEPVGPVIPAVEWLPPFQPPSSNQREKVEAWRRRHAMYSAEGRVPGEYSPERRPQWERTRAAYVDMPFR